MFHFNSRFFLIFNLLIALTLSREDQAMIPYTTSFGVYPFAPLPIYQRFFIKFPILNKCFTSFPSPHCQNIDQAPSLLFNYL
uniref:Putative secreted protein n=1 Tax=Ixodes ricinus TaxID=34613 RepID=A0A6B0U615_IXORI